MNDKFEDIEKTLENFRNFQAQYEEEWLKKQFEIVLGCRTENMSLAELLKIAEIHGIQIYRRVDLRRNFSDRYGLVFEYKDYRIMLKPIFNWEFDPLTVSYKMRLTFVEEFI